MRIPLWIKLVTGFFVTLSAMVLVGCYFLLDAGCVNEILYAEKSPDGSLEAVVFQRACGATTDFSTQVSIFRSWLPRGNSSGNIFVADTDHGKAPSGPGGGPDVKTRWASEKELVVAYPGMARVFRSEPGWGTVKITYENFPR